MPTNERIDVGVRDGIVRVDREQQRDVDVDPLVQRLLDRRYALGCAGDLDHHVRAVEPPPVVADLDERAVGVVRQLRGHLQ